MLFEGCNYCMKKGVESAFARQTLLSEGANLCYGLQCRFPEETLRVLAIWDIRS
jgi:hypothetical protein